jgi:hypothetical protein
MSLALGLAGFAAPNLPSASNSGLSGAPIPSSKPMILNSVAYAINAVGGNVIVPNASQISSAYKVIGVELAKPNNITTETGVTWRDWGITFLISDEPFVNGSSLQTDFTGHLITVMESPTPGILNSYGHALSYMARQQICQAFTNGTQICKDVTDSSTGHLIQIGSTWLVVNKGGYVNGDFTMDGVNRAIYIDGDLSYDQMVATAESMIPS